MSNNKQQNAVQRIFAIVSTFVLLTTTALQPHSAQAQSPSAKDVGIVLTVSKMVADHTTETGWNDRDEIFITSTVVRFRPDGSRYDQDSTRLPRDDDYYEFKNGWDGDGRGWTNKDQKKQGRPVLWNGVIRDGEAVSILANISEQDNEDLGSWLRVVHSLGILAASKIPYVGAGVAAGLSAVGAAIRNNGNDSVGGFGVTIKNNGGQLSYQWEKADNTEWDGSYNPTLVARFTTHGDDDSRYRIEASAVEQLRSPLYGGSGGGEFTAVLSSLNDVWIRSGAWIDSLQVGWKWGPFSWKSDRFGGEGGGLNYFQMPAFSGEYIVAVKGRSGDYIDSLTFITNKGRQFGPFGGDGGGPFEFNAPAGYRIVGFYGRSGLYLDAIGFVYSRIP